MADISQLFYTGPGTSYTKGVLDPDISRGVITAFRNTGVDDAEDAAEQAEDILPSTYPGDAALPLNYVSVKLMGAGQALFIGYYGRSRRGQFVRRLQIHPLTGRTATTYLWPGDAEDEEKIDPATGYLRPRTLYVPQSRIIWSDVLFQQSAPNLQFSTQGTINANAYTIEGIQFAAGTLMFNGLSVVYDKWSAYDRWYVSYEATFDAASWENGELDTTSAPGTPVSVSLYPDARHTTWPNMPPT